MNEETKAKFYHEKAKELLPILNGLTVYEARMVLDAAVTEIAKSAKILVH